MAKMTESSQRRGRSRGTKLITIIGNLGSDPEMRYTQSGVAFTSFSVAVNDFRRGKDGQDEEHTDWFRVTCWRGLAEIANNYLQRGSQVFVEGRFRTSEWTGNDGQTRMSLEVDANNLQLLARSREDGPGGGGGGGGAPAARPDGGGGGGGDGGPPPEPAGGGGESVDPDDLPF
jgi:single-strand DNA-binding protein